MAQLDDEIVTVGVHEFPTEVLVEVTHRDEEGFLVVRSFQFDYVDDGVTPVVDVPDDVVDTVHEALSEEGYTVCT